MGRPEGKTIETDVVVIGGGLAGLAQACLLGRHGVETICVDREAASSGRTTRKAAEKFDARTTAISWGSHHVLRAAGAWDALEAHAEPILDIRVADGKAPFFLHFDHTDVGERPFGWIIDNQLIRRALSDRAKACENITHRTGVSVTGLVRGPDGVTATLDDGTTIRARLAIAADGKHSAMRAAAGIGTSTHDYGQSAIVLIAGHERPHDNIAIEHFHETGPFATLPMVDAEDGTHRSSVVWTETTERAPLFLAMPEDVFQAELQKRFGDWLGKVHAIGTPQAWPLKLVHAKSYTSERLALVGDAAHAIHPIAGQGLNLSLRDIALMAEIVVEAMRLGLDPGSASLLARYDRERRADNTMMVAATDGLNRLFSNEIAPVSMARGIGLGIVQRVPPLKKFFMRQAMGSVGKLPRLVRGEGL